MPPPIQWPLPKGLTAAITGGTTVIGRAITLEYIRQGCSVMVNHLGLPRDEPLRKSLLKEAGEMRRESLESSDKTTAIAGEIVDLVGDITEPGYCKDLVQATVDRWGELNVFIANAGVFQPAEFLE